MFQQLSQLWHVIQVDPYDELDSGPDLTPSGLDTLDAVGSGRDTKNDNTNDDDEYDGGDSLELPCYNMEHKKRGKFIIINNENFELPYASTRTGTDEDAKALDTVLKKIGFEVKTEKDQTVVKMTQLIKAVAKEDHSDCDCFGVAVLSHGTSQDVLYGTDGLIELTTLIEPLKNCPSLNGKPKLIIIQACRGEKLIPAVKVAADAGPSVDVRNKSPYAPDSSHTDKDTGAMDVIDGPVKAQMIPREADFIYVHATPPGHFAWRNTGKGSWFIQALCKQLHAYAYKVDLVTLLTLVNNQVAYDYKSATKERATNDMRQVSSVVSMLTKMLWLKPKN